MKSSCCTWAFRNGMKQTNWGIDLLLKSLHSLFNETPARREDYMKNHRK